MFSRFLLSFVPSTPGSGARREASIPSRNFEGISSTNPFYDSYYRHLSVMGNGIPIWIPEPNENLNASYRKQGVSVGDVIFFTPDGAWDFLFSICLPAEHEINSRGVPEGFIPFSLKSTDTRRSQHYDNNHHLASNSITKTTGGHPTSQAHSRSTTYTRNPFHSLHSDQAADALGSISNRGANISERTAEVTFISSASEGAILTMPEGAYSEDVTRVPEFQQYLAENLASWYKFANEFCGWGVEMGNLRLVTGAHKAKAWGIATFKFTEETTEINVNLQLKTEVTHPYGKIYSWECSGINDSPRTGPTTAQRESLFRSLPEEERGESFENQCLFVRTMNSAIRNPQGIRDSRADGMMNQVDDYAHSDVASRTAGGRVGASQIPSALKTGETHGRLPGGRNASYDLSIVRNGPVLRDHPSKAINDFLLKEKPNGRIAITHDEHWISLLTESDIVIPTGDEFLARLTKSYRIVEDLEGIISLEPVQLVSHSSESYLHEASSREKRVDKLDVDMMSDVESKHKQSSSVLENLTTHVDRNYWNQIASSTSHSQGHSGYASSQLILVPQPEIAFSSNENYHAVQQPAPNTSVPQSEIVPTDQNPDSKLQLEFLEFLMANRGLLNTITKPTNAVTLIQNEFAKDIQSRGLVPPILDIQKIGQRFKPVLGSAAIRQQRDSRTQTTRARIIRCPFPFCDAHFTTRARIKYHLSAHFRLTPSQCLRCGRCFSVASIRRHSERCTGGASSQRDHFGPALDYAHETVVQDPLQVAESLPPGGESTHCKDVDSDSSDDEDELEAYWEDERGNAQVSEDIAFAEPGMYGKQDVASRFSELWAIDDF